MEHLPDAVTEGLQYEQADWCVHAFLDLNMWQDICT